MGLTPEAWEKVIAQEGKGESKSVGGARRVWEGPGAAPACMAQAAGRIAFPVSKAVRTACEEQQDGLEREESPAQLRARLGREDKAKVACDLWVSADTAL